MDELNIYQYPQLYTDQQKVENLLKRELTPEEVGYLPYMIESVSEVIKRYTGRVFIGDSSPTDRFFDAENELTREIFVDDYWSICPLNQSWIFTIDAGNPAIGAQYTNNGITFTVQQVYTNPESGQIYLICSGISSPEPSGTLVTMTNTPNITFTTSANHVAIEVATLNIWDNQITGSIIPPYSYIEYPLSTTWKSSIRFRGFPFALGGRRFRVKAQWGFSKTPPGGITHAATLLVLHLLENPQDLQQESIEGYSRTFAPRTSAVSPDDNELSIPPKIRIMLDLYKKRSADL